MSKQLLIILAIILAALPGYSQESTKLDEKNGFQGFSFGTPASAYSGKIRRSTSKEVLTHAQTYHVISEEFKRVMGKDVENFTLTFGKNKLCAITIDFTEESDDDAYRFLYYKLVNIFGEPAGEISPSTDELFDVSGGARWNGKKTTLDIYKVLRKSTGKYCVSIYYIHNNFMKEVINDEF
jgi:hypothetical protein